jgi:hypothetical protein
MEKLGLDDLETVKSVLSANTTELVHGEQESEVQQSRLRRVMIAFDRECARLYQEDHVLKEPLIQGPMPIYWTPVDVQKVTQSTEAIVNQFTDSPRVLTRISSGLPRLAIGLFGTIGLHYTREHFTTTWPAKMMPNVFGVSVPDVRVGLHSLTSRLTAYRRLHGLHVDAHA